MSIVEHKISELGAQGYREASCMGVVFKAMPFQPYVSKRFGSFEAFVGDASPGHKKRHAMIYRVSSDGRTSDELDHKAFPADDRSGPFDWAARKLLELSEARGE